MGVLSPAMSIRRCNRFSLGFLLELFNLQRFAQPWQSSTSFIIHNFKYIPLRPCDLSRKLLKPFTKTKTCSLQRGSANISTFQRYMQWSITLQPFSPVDHLMDHGYNTESPERLHIDFAKEAYQASNKKDYVQQMHIWQLQCIVSHGLPKTYNVASYTVLPGPLYVVYIYTLDIHCIVLDGSTGPARGHRCRS